MLAFREIPHGASVVSRAGFYLQSFSLRFLCNLFVLCIFVPPSECPLPTIFRLGVCFLASHARCSIFTQEFQGVLFRWPLIPGVKFPPFVQALQSYPHLRD